MLKYELVVIWESGERDLHQYDTLDEADEAASNYKLVFGNQILWAGTRPKVVDEQFKIDDLKEWLYAISLNNLDQSDCLEDIIKRLPGFIQYVKDKKAGVL